MKQATLLLLFIAIPLALAAPPTVPEVTIASEHYLQAGANTPITCNATINDTDGYQDITAATAVFYDQTVTTSTGADDDNDHYTNTSCLLHNGSGDQVAATCTFMITYYANPSQNWTCNLTATDGGNNATGESTKSTIAELQALSVSSITYEATLGGPLPLGTVSIQRSMNVTNLGNTDIGIRLSGDNNSLECDIGSIPLSNQRYNTTNGFGFSAGTPLTTTPTTIDPFTVAQRTDDQTPSTDQIYWLLQLPMKGVGGSCQGSIYVEAT